jgi:hypothetical protein
LSQPEICFGDQCSLRFSATRSRRRALTESRGIFSDAELSASCAPRRARPDSIRVRRCALLPGLRSRRPDPDGRRWRACNLRPRVPGRSPLARSPGDVADGLPGLPSLPQLVLACRRQSSWTTQPRHSCTSGPDNTENLTCCTDQLHRPVEPTPGVRQPTQTYVPGRGAHRKSDNVVR